MWAIVREMLTLVLLESDDLREAERYLIEVGDLADRIERIVLGFNARATRSYETCGFRARAVLAVAPST